MQTQPQNLEKMDPFLLKIAPREALSIAKDVILLQFSTPLQKTNYF